MPRMEEHLYLASVRFEHHHTETSSWQFDNAVHVFPGVKMQTFRSGGHDSNYCLSIYRGKAISSQENTRDAQPHLLKRHRKLIIIHSLVWMIDLVLVYKNLFFFKQQQKGNSVRCDRSAKKKKKIETGLRLELQMQLKSKSVYKRTQTETHFRTDK